MSEQGTEQLGNDESRIKAIARSIATGHAFAKHNGEFGSLSQEAFIVKVERTLRGPSLIMELKRGRMPYWDDDEYFVVITNPRDAHGGTAFWSRTGKSHLDTVE